MHACVGQCRLRRVIDALPKRGGSAVYMNLLRGMLAGLVATSVLSLLVAAKRWVPQLDSVTALDGLAHNVNLALGLPSPVTGWVLYVAMGVVWWGWLFAVMAPILPGQRFWQKGFAFGVIAALLVWLMVMPLAGAGYFGLHLNPMQPLVTLVEHLVYGVVLGAVYGRLRPRTGDVPSV